MISRLAGSIHDFPLVTDQSRGRYHLRDDLQQQWYRLEFLLIKMYETLLATRPELGHPIEMKPFRLPSAWGYMKDHESEKAARIRIWNSRNAFVPLMALCMYAICVCEGRNSIPLEDRINIHWIKALIDAGFSPEWVNSLANSSFFSMRTLRVGVYIEFKAFHYPHLLRLYIEFGVPIWVLLPAEGPSGVPAFLLPNTRMPQALDRRTPMQQQQQQQPFDGQDDSTFCSGNVPASRQIRGESVHDFINRSKQRIQRLYESESPDDRTKRLDRERAAAQFNVPGRSGAYVFEWIEGVNGSYIRTYVPRTRVPDIWDSYANTQKWYDSSRNEWDLSAALDPHASVIDEEEFDNDQDYYFNKFKSQYGDDPSPGLEPQLSIGHAALTQSELQDLYVDRLPTPTKVQTPILDDILFQRYGFHYDGQPYNSPARSLPDSRLSRILVDVTFDVSHHRDAAIHYLSYLINGQPIPPCFFDLHVSNGTPLRTHGNNVFEVRIISDHRFVIRSRASPTEFIQVPYASTAVEALRLHNCRTVSELALHFVSRGTYFYLGPFIIDKDPFREPPGKAGGLGFRPQDYTPTWVDYQAYIRRRSDLLNDPSIIRSALMKGGIVWRLTVDTIQSTADTIEYSKLFDSADVEPVELTKRDLGIIVGLYLVWTGTWLGDSVIRSELK